MTGDRYHFVWTDPDGSRHANAYPLDRLAAVQAAATANRHQTKGAVYAVVAAADMKTWKEYGKMDGTTESWADAEPMMTNAAGDQVPERFVTGRAKLEDQTVRILRDKAKAMQGTMLAFKAAAFSDVHAFLGELFASYRIDPAGKRGGVVLKAFDGLSKVEISVADSLTFGPELHVAKELIDQCITAWAKDAKPELTALINDAFRVGGTGKIQVARVLGLRRMNFPDAKWQLAMVAISDAVRVEGSVNFIRFYTRAGADSAWDMITLDMSRL